LGQEARQVKVADIETNFVVVESGDFEGVVGEHEGVVGRREADRFDRLADTSNKSAVLLFEMPLDEDSFLTTGDQKGRVCNELEGSNSRGVPMQGLNNGV